MIMENEFTKQLISCDIVAWNGVITEWGNVRGHYEDGDEIRMANEEEVLRYKEKKNG